MKLVDRVLNEFDKSTGIEESLTILKNALDGSGIEYSIFNPTRYRNVPTYYCSIKFTKMGMGVNGKGTTPESSLASAMGEACERLQTSVGTTIRATHLTPFLLHASSRGKHLPGYQYGHQSQMVNPVTVESIFSNITCTQEDIERIKNTNVAKHWVKGYSLVNNKEAMVPYQLASIINGSSGLSAGINIEDAIIQGASECFERYAVRNLLAGNIEIPTLDKKYLDEFVQQLINDVEKEGIKITLKDYSNNGTIPVIAGIFEALREPETRVSRRQIVFGASPNMNIAATRCITEYFQGWENHVIDMQNHRALALNEWSKTKDLWSSNFQCFMGDLTDIQRFAATSQGYKTPEKTTNAFIQSLVNSCKKLNTDLIVVNATKPFIGIPTVRIIIPGVSELAHMQFNLVGDIKHTKDWLSYSIESFEALDGWYKYFNKMGIDIGEQI